MILRRYYYGARYYDPKTSVFLGVDPKSGKAPNESPYAYCSNNPIKFVDPDGKFKTWFGAAVYSVFNGGKIGTHNNGERFVSKPNKGSTVNEPGMLPGVDVSEQRRFYWKGRSSPNMPASQASERPTLRAQDNNSEYYSNQNCQLRETSTKYDQIKQNLENTDAVSFGSPETGLGGVQTLVEGIKAGAEIGAFEALGIGAISPVLHEVLDVGLKVRDLHTANKLIEDTRRNADAKPNTDPITP